jgi:signal transduction histidine kinase
MRVFNFLLLIFFFIACKQTSISKEEFNQQIVEEGKYLSPSLELMTKREFKLAIQLLDSLHFHQKNKTFFSPLEYYSVKKVIYQNAGNEDGFLLYTDSAIQFIEKNKLTISGAELYSGLLLSKASILFNKHQPDAANALFFKVQEFSRLNNTLASQYSIAEQLAYIAYQQKNYGLALQSFKETWQLQTSIKPYTDVYVTAQLINNVALCFDKLGKIDSAMWYYQFAIDVLEQHKEKLFNNVTIESSIASANKSKGVVLGNMAHLMYKKGNIDTAIILSKQSIAINTKGCCEQRDAQLVQMRLIDMYADKKMFDSMFIELHAIRNALDTMPNLQPELNYQRQMAKYFEVMNEPQKAFSYFKRFTIMKDSLNALEQKDAESDIVKDLQIKQQEADLSLLKKTNQLSKLYLYFTIGLIMASLIIIALVYINFKKSRATNRSLTLLNEQVTHQKAELELANKDKDRILRVVAHDLRNPISGIAALSKTVIDNGLEDAKQEKYLQLIEKTANSSLGLINELLQANTLVPATNFQSVSINQLLQHTVTLTQHQAQAKQQLIQLQLPDSNIVLPLVYENFERVMLNLITNAIKFSTIKASIKVELQLQVSDALIKVSDTGIGIPKQHINEVFSALPSIKRTGTAGEKSFGLGLSICKQIVEAHHGKIWVESVEDEGTVFYIQLPLATNT